MNAEVQIAHLHDQVESLTAKVDAMAVQLADMGEAMERFCTEARIAAVKAETAASQADYAAAPRAFRLEGNCLGSKIIVTEAGIRVEADPIVLVNDPDTATIPAGFTTSAARTSPETAAASASGAEALSEDAVTAYPNASHAAADRTHGTASRTECIRASSEAITHQTTA